MIIVDGNPNEQASIDSKVLEAGGHSELPHSASPTILTPAPPPYYPQPPSNTGFLAAQNHETVTPSHPGPPDSHQESASKRFLKAFACALFVITLIRMLVWSMDLVSSHGRREPHEWMGSLINHKPHDAERLSEKLGCGSGHCPPHPGPPPRRIVPIQYPPHVSRPNPDTSTQLA